MQIKSFFQKPLYLLVLTIIISFVLIVLLYGIVKLEEKIEDDIFEISTSDVLTIAQNNANAIKLILNTSNNYIEDIKTNTLLQQKIESNIKMLLTDNIKYSYLLYKDKRGIFRFLADASSPNEKALINQKFDVDSRKWFDIYEIKNPIILKHTFLHQLSISYLIPILYKNEVELILAIDFSVKKAEEINSIITLMKQGIVLIIGISFVFLVIFIIQVIRYRAVKKTAFIDKLTKVYNRNYLYELEKSIDLNNYILATIDIDYFKKVNDTYGHDAGDKVLQQTAELMLLSIRTKDDIIIRYGGEEFVLFIKNKNLNHLIALNVLDRIFKNTQKHKFFIDEKETINVTISMGVNTNPQNSKSFAEAFKCADKALYQAKNSGRNKIVIYEGEEV